MIHLHAFGDAGASPSRRSPEELSNEGRADAGPSVHEVLPGVSADAAGALKTARLCVSALTRSRELVLLMAVAALASGTLIDLGNLAPVPMGLMVVGMALLLLAPYADPSRSAGKLEWMAAVAVPGSIASLYGLVSSLLLVLMLGVCLAAIVIVIANHRGMRLLAAAASVAALTAAVASVWQWGWVNIDVFVSLQKAAAALLSGQNPYGVTFLAHDVTGPTSSIEVPVHFQYLPGAAILAVPGRLLGDVRVVSFAASAMLIGFAANLGLGSPEASERAWRVTALSLVVPLTLAMIHFGWVDVYCMAGFAGWVSLRNSHPRWGLVCLVVALTVKPTILIAVAPLFLWSSRARRETIIAAVVAIAVSLPFAIATGLGAFYQDVIGIQTQLGFWYGSLTVGSAWFALTGHLLSNWVGPVAGCAAGLLIVRKRPQDMGDVLVQGAALSTAAFLLSKWAFLNYYYMPVWLLVLAVAGRGVLFETDPAEIRLPRPRPEARRPVAAGAETVAAA